MSRYSLTIYQPDGPPPPGLDHARILRDVTAVNDEMKKAGVWIFADALAPADLARVARGKSGDVVVTDGPYVEGKEHVGGFYVIEVQDRDTALYWAKRLGEALTLPIEVRAFAGHGG